MEGVCEAKIVSTSICVICDLCWFSIGFYMFFEIWRVLCSSYFRLFVASFFESNFDRFLSDLGVILGSFGGPKSIIFGVEILWIWACRSKSGPRAAKGGPRAAQGVTRAAKSGPGAAQERPRAAQERPRAVQSSPRAAPAVGLLVEQKMSQVGGIGR